jgi:ubiquinone/menaquinone biosynthesis C-methylase UbiE
MTEAAAQPSNDELKERIRRQWQTIAPAWDRWTPVLSDWLAPVTDAMVRAAAIAPGQRVLDVAAGAGEPALTIAQRVGPTGSVVATDLSDAILAYAAGRARDASLANVETHVMDGERLDLPDASLDAAVSRLGVIYFPDRPRAVAEMHRVLRRGGRIAIAGITNPAANPFSAATFAVIAARAGLPRPAPNAPGPYSMGSPDVMTGVLAGAGFVDVRADIVDAPLRLRSAEDAAQLQREAFGFDGMLGGLPPAEREATWAEVVAALRAFETTDGFESPAQFIVGSGRKG